MQVHAWVPYREMTSLLPEGVTTDVYDGSGRVPPGQDEVEFFVLPYAFGDNPMKLMADMPQLRVAQSLTAGYDHVLPFLPKHVRLCRAGGVHGASTAELAIALMLAALRGLPAFVRAQDMASWRHERHDALADKRVLIIGYGEVGQAIDRRLSGFEVDVRRVARHAREGVSAVGDLKDLLPETDVAVIALPLTDATRALVDRSFLRRLPDRALVVNVARGPIIDTAALLEELNSGRLRAAIDVTEIEPLPADSPLWTAPGLLLTPHVGGNTSAFLPRAVRLVSEQLRRYVTGEQLEYDVTPEDASATH